MLPVATKLAINDELIMTGSTTELFADPLFV